WIDFLNTHQVNSIAVGLGGKVLPEYLDPVAYNGQISENTDGLLVADLDQLDDVLVNTFTNTVDGTLLAGGPLDQPNSGVGADGGHVQQVAFDLYQGGATQFVYDPAAGSITVTGEPDVDHRGVFDAATRTLTVSTLIGGSFAIDLDRGAYVYTGPAGSVSDSRDAFDFVVVDGDGDSAGSSIRVDIVNQQTQLGTAGDDILVGTEVADRIIGLGGNDTIGGGANDDMLIGNGGNDVLHGDAGADRLFGGDGVDVLRGGDGADRLDGGAGNDALSGGNDADVFSWTLYDKGSPGSPAVDSISDFTVAARADGGDALDLRDLLVGESNDTLDQYLDFLVVGAGLDLRTELRISSEGGFAGGTYDAAVEDQRIVFEGLDIRAELGLAADAPDAAIIQTLLNRNDLIVDSGL
ncbi:MAG: type I secretion C-terminal target domain-containing protein, partial [Rubrivivax sp.]|nr:type I secretion C-terminal target domain-containing protein [Rubrivivax sp.]